MHDMHLLNSSENPEELPLGYDESRIMIMPRDPHWLYAYWEISGNTRADFIKEFGSEIWEKSEPVIKITNLSKNTHFYIRINDYANNWYINVPDSNCVYSAELGRNIHERFFIGFTGSNRTRTPGDCVSTNNTIFFSDYREVILDRMKPVVYSVPGSIQIIPDSGFAAVPGSLEMFHHEMHAQVIGLSSIEAHGISSGEFLGISSAEFLGISSTEFLRSNSNDFFEISTNEFFNLPKG